MLPSRPLRFSALLFSGLQYFNAATQLIPQSSYIEDLAMDVLQMQRRSEWCIHMPQSRL
jgi:hypothetical protein